MRKIYLRTMVVAAILLLCSTANAFSVVINGISYELDSFTKTASVEWNNKYTGDITIPGVVVYDGTTYKVERIGDRAFSGCKSLTSINIPNSVTSIGEWAFIFCTSLTSINIPNSVTTIEEKAFFGCTSLTNIDIPNSVTSIGEYAFSYCTSLKSVTIGNSVAIVGHLAFNECTSLTDIYCNATTAPQAYGSVFSYLNYTNATLHVPAEAIEEYRNSTPWSEFGSIVALTDEDISLGVNDIESAQPRITAGNGFFTISGATEGSVVTVYTASGIAAGKATVTNGTATIETTIQKGETAIVTAGGKSIKVVAQ